MVLQPPLRKGAIICVVTKEDQMLAKQTRTKVDGLQMVPLWFFGILYDYVWNHGIQDLCGIQRCIIPQGGGKTVLDVPCAVGLCFLEWFRPGLGGAVCFWFLWADADIRIDRIDCHGALPAKNVVFVLSYGNNDTGNLSDQTQKWKMK